MDIKVGDKIKIISDNFQDYGLYKGLIVTVKKVDPYNSPMVRIEFENNNSAWVYPDKYLFEKIIKKYKIRRVYDPSIKHER